MKNRSYRSIIGISLLILVMTAANIVFYVFYPNELTSDITLAVTLFNAIYLALFLHITYYFSSGYISQKLQQSNLSNILYSLIQRTTVHDKTEDLYQDLLNAAVEAVPAAKKGCIMLLDPISDKLNYVAVEGYDWEVLKSTYLDLKDSFLYRETNGHIEQSVVIDDPFGYDRKHLSSANISQILSAGSDDVMSTISTPIIINGKLYGMINVDSPLRYVYTKNDVNLIELFAYEITNVIRLYESMEMNSFLSNHDTLTGVYNRYYVNGQIIQQMTPDRKVALVSMDLNHLKGTNDTFGHSIGDRLLVQFTRGLTMNKPENSDLARYGGDEFLLFIQNPDMEAVEKLMSEITTWFKSNPVTIGEFQIHVSFSYGIATYPDESKDFETILHIADQRMYEQKRQKNLLEKAAKNI